MSHSLMEDLLRFIAALLCLVVSCSAALAENAQFKFLKTVSVKELNAILDAERTTFLSHEVAGPGYQLPPVSKATNAVDIYTVRYDSHIPELGNRRISVTGLLAIPKLADLKSVRLISYQHGTVFPKYAVPSFAFKQHNPTPFDTYDDSYETRYMVGLFAGNGYAVMAADYFGLGGNASDNESYMMKQSSAQSSFDLYFDVKRYLADSDIKISDFFLGGWSQGGLNTTGLLEKFESRGIKVRAAFSATNPNDPLAALNAALFHPMESDAKWINTIIALTVFSCQNFIGPADLARKTISPKYYDTLKSIYERSYGTPQGNPEALRKILIELAGVPNIRFLREELRDPAKFAASDYGKCLAESETYRQEFKTPIRMYYGTSDEVIRVRVARLPYDYHLAMNSTPDAEAESKIKMFPVDGGTHRLTFINATHLAKPWIDRLR